MGICCRIHLRIERICIKKEYYDDDDKLGGPNKSRRRNVLFPLHDMLPNFMQAIRQRIMSGSATAVPTT